jgi:predicted transcriptional regulator
VTADSDRPYVDSLSLTDVDTEVYETIATLEFTGRAATRREIAVAADLDETTTDATLCELTRRGMLTRSEHDGEQAFQPRHRGWSTAPDQRQGKGL